MPDLIHLSEREVKETESDEKERILESRKAYYVKAITKYPSVENDKNFQKAATKGEMQRAVKSWLIRMKAKGQVIIPQIDKEWQRG